MAFGASSGNFVGAEAKIATPLMPQIVRKYSTLAFKNHNFKHFTCKANENYMHLKPTAAVNNMQNFGIFRKFNVFRILRILK